MLEPGSRIGDWIVDAPLDEGGMGAVYRCHNVFSERIHAAVKVMDPKRADVSRDRFLREVEALASLRHQAVVRVLGFGIDDERRLYFIAMEMVEGKSLARRVEEGPWRWPGPRNTFVQIASGLAHAHARGIAHRDIKPPNLMISDDGGGTILDFGISAEQGRTSLTGEGMFLGTITHMAPELFGRGTVDPIKADIYALGQVFYEVLTGERAFTANAALTSEQRMVYVMAAKINCEPLDPGPGNPEELRALIRSATSPLPESRPVDMRSFAAALELVSLDPGPELPVPRPAPPEPTVAMRTPHSQAPLPTLLVDLPLEAGVPTRSTRAAATPPSGSIVLPPTVATGSGVVPPPPVVPSGSGPKPRPPPPEPPAAAVESSPPRAAEAAAPTALETWPLRAVPTWHEERQEIPEHRPAAASRSPGLKGLGLGLLVGIPLGLAVLLWVRRPETPPEQPTPTQAPVAPLSEAKPAEKPTEIAPTPTQATPAPTPTTAETPSKRARGPVRVEGEAGARVSVDGHTEGIAPLTITLEEGRHFFVVDLPDGYRLAKSLEIRFGRGPVQVGYSAAQSIFLGPAAADPAEPVVEAPRRVSVILGLSLEGDLYSPAISPVIEAQRRKLESCYLDAGASGVTTVNATWTLDAGAFTAGPAASGGPANMKACVESTLRALSFDNNQTGKVSLEIEFKPVL